MRFYLLICLRKITEMIVQVPTPHRITWYAVIIINKKFK